MEREKHFSSGAGYDLDNLHRELLTKLGRGEEALEAAWTARLDAPVVISSTTLWRSNPEAGPSATMRPRCSTAIRCARSDEESVSLIIMRMIRYSGG